MPLDSPRKTLAQFKEENAARLDSEWAQKYPNGLGYIIQFKDGNVVWGVLTARPTSHTQRSKWRGTTGGGWSGWYMGKGFAKWRVQSHKTYPDLDTWAGDLAEIFSATTME